MLLSSTVLATAAAGTADDEDVMVPGLDTAGQASKAQLPDSAKAKIGVRCCPLLCRVAQLPPEALNDQAEQRVSNCIAREHQIDGSRKIEMHAGPRDGLSQQGEIPDQRIGSRDDFRKSRRGVKSPAGRYQKASKRPPKNAEFHGVAPAVPRNNHPTNGRGVQTDV